MLNGQKCVAVIQVRYGATRLPGKVFEDIGGKPLLEWVLEFADKLEAVDEVVVATTIHASDDRIAEFCLNLGYHCFRGDIDNVWSRFAGVCRQTSADWVVRICGDNPFLDAALAGTLFDCVVSDPGYDYYSYRESATGIPAIRTHYGFFVEVVSSTALLKIGTMDPGKDDLEHVTKALYDRPDVFSGGYLPIPTQLIGSGLRGTIDTVSDLEVVRSVIKSLGRYPEGFADVLTVVNNERGLLDVMAMNILENEK